MLGMSARVIWEDIPNVEFVKRLCEDIYSARTDREYALEEAMYGELIQLYRQPQMLYERSLPVAPLQGHTNYPATGRIQDKDSKQE